MKGGRLCDAKKEVLFFFTLLFITISSCMERRTGGYTEIKRRTLALRAPDEGDVQEKADNETALGESDLGGMCVPQLPPNLAGIFPSSGKSHFMFILASFTTQTRAFDEICCPTSGEMFF